MQPVHFEEILDAVVANDSRYAREAYHFVREALDHTQRKIYPINASAGRPPEHRHVTGQQLLEGIREYGIEQFGPMTYHVLTAWGLQRCEDVGEVVFNLVEHGRNMFGKTEQDTRSDFQNGYGFEEAFRQPFLPRHRGRPRARQMREA